MNIQRYNEDDFNAFVEDLIRMDRLSDKESGIAKLYLDKGYDNLSSKQKYIFDKAIENNYISACNRCVMEIPWCEMIEALDNGGYCNYCQHMMERSEEEDSKFMNSISASTITTVNEECITNPNTHPASSTDSSINLSYMLSGKTFSTKITEQEIETAYQSSLTNQ